MTVDRVVPSVKNTWTYRSFWSYTTHRLPCRSCRGCNVLGWFTHASQWRGLGLVAGVASVIELTRGVRHADTGNGCLGAALCGFLGGEHRQEILVVDVHPHLAVLDEV